MSEQSPRMSWPYPTRDDDPWVDAFSDFVNAVDGSVFASREDRSVVWSGGGTLSWTLSSETFAWTETINVYSPMSAKLIQIAAGSIADWKDGEVVYVEMTRLVLVNTTKTLQKSTALPSSDDATALGVRIGNVVYFRTGISLGDGDTAQGIAPVPGTGGGTDPNAIHDNVAAEINVIAAKATPIAADEVLIEDSADATPYAKKKVLAGNLGSAIKLDDLAAPDDNTDLNATTGAHGLLSKLPGGSTSFLRADGTWAVPPGGGGDPSLPDIQQVLFVDKTSGSYTADGTIQFPYNSIDAALTAASLLTPGPTNRFGIIVMPGRYNERFRLRDYCYVIGMNKEACYMHYASGSTILATNVTSGVWNMTIEQESTFYLAWIAGTSSVELHNCHFIGAGNTGNVFYTEDTAVLKCWHCMVENTDPDLEVSWCLESSSQFFYDCEFYGLLYANNTATTSRYYFKDCRIEGSIYSSGQNSLECYNTDIDASNNTTYLNPIYVFGNEEYIKLIRMELIPASTAYDISFGSSVDVECDNVRMVNGTDRFGFIVSQEGIAHVGGNYDCYANWSNMVNTVDWSGRGPYRIILHEDVASASINMSGAHDPITIDGQGRFSWSHTTPGNTISLSTGWLGDQWTFERLTINDSMQISTPSATLDAEAIFKDCTINGAIKHSVGTNTGTLLIELTHNSKVYGNSTDLYAIMIGCNPSGTPAKIIVHGGSYVQGYVGYPAIYHHNLTGPGDLRIAFATVLHGSLGANNPFGDDGVPTTPIAHKATHSRFNSDPEASANYSNSIAPGQRFNSFDPAVAF